MDKKYAYVALLTTNNFMPGMLALWKSFTLTNSKYPLYCVVTPEITEENRRILTVLGIKLIDRPEIPLTPAIYKFNTEHEHDHQGWYKAFSKFHVFGLEQFDKIVYLDNDLILQKNIDDLFDKPHMSGVVDCEGLNSHNFDYLIKGDNYLKYFNSGVLVIEPSMQLYNNIMEFVNNIVPDRILADQNILSMYYHEWKDNMDLHLPVYYNLLVTTLDKYLNLPWFNINEVKIFHFVNKKPWFYSKNQFMHLGNYGLMSIRYIDMINGVISMLQDLGLTSKDLKIIQ